MRKRDRNSTRIQTTSKILFVATKARSALWTGHFAERSCLNLKSDPWFSWYFGKGETLKRRSNEEWCNNLSLLFDWIGLNLAKRCVAEQSCANKCSCVCGHTRLCILEPYEELTKGINVLRSLLLFWEFWGIRRAGRIPGSVVLRPASGVSAQAGGELRRRCRTPSDSSPNNRIWDLAENLWCVS